MLHLVQPLVRLEGRLRHGLTPWRRHARAGGAFPVTRHLERWSEEWIDPAEWVRGFERGIVAEGAVVRRGGDFDGWDLETRGGTLAGVRVTTAVEDHGSGRQLARLRCRPTLSVTALALTALLLALCLAAAIDGALVAAIVLGLVGAALGLRILTEASWALAITTRVLSEERSP
jgi:O-antigen biosynthesis protein